MSFHEQTSMSYEANLFFYDNIFVIPNIGLSMRDFN